MPKLNVAVIYGGTNTEHEISIITALQAMHALLEAGYTVTPIYISKQNQWFTGDAKFLKPQFYQNLNQPESYGQSVITQAAHLQPKLFTIGSLNRLKPLPPIDAIFPIFHGKYGEDGTIQGLVNLLNLPLIGSSLPAASIGINKHLSKTLVGTLGFPTVPGVLVPVTGWANKPQHYLKQARQLGSKLIVKPNFSGSSIGVKKVTSTKELTQALDVALSYDQAALIETALTGFIEVNISILGNDPYQLSVTEQPLTTHDTLTFEDKYAGDQKQKGGGKGMASAQRLIPAPIKPAIVKQIETIATEFYRLIGGRGLARLDFFVQKDTVIFNEINIIPGSLAFYLWSKSGLNFPQLVTKLVDLGLEDFAKNQNLIKTFPSNILQTLNLQGSKTQK